MIQIETQVKAPIQATWDAFNDPRQILLWNAATPEWHCPAAANDLREGGKFSYTMAARDGSFSFDFDGTYDEVSPSGLLRYTLGDGRKVEVLFTEVGDVTNVVQRFEPEKANPEEMQRQGWQAILDNFKRHVEGMGE